MILTEKEEFCENIRACEKAMYALAFSVVKNESDAAEVISEAVYRAYKNMHTLQNESSFKPWILRIVHNTAVELIRKNSKIVPMYELEDACEDSCENETATRLTVKNAVDRLNQPYRTVVVLFYYENLSVSKIAQITGKNAVSVRKQLSRARKMLRETLKEDFRQ